VTKRVKGSLQMVEILHVDTVNSRQLYKEFKLNPEEKARCQKIMQDSFRKICRMHRGVPYPWAGDGGYAFFPCDKTFGQSAVIAAELILNDMCNMNAQTAGAINATEFYRSIRLKAHRGEVYVTEESGIDSADPKHFDDFLKFEKRFAPKEDEFFITQEVYDVLESQLKKRFGYFKEVRAGSIKTKLYLMKRKPIKKSDDIFKRGDEVQSITDADWQYLREHILSHKKNITVRNSITTGLTKAVLENYRNKGLRQQLIKSRTLFELTLRGLYNYLRAIDRRHRFSVSYWMPFDRRGKKFLKMYDFRYPNEEFASPSSRIVPVSNNRYKVCQSFNNIEPIATPSVKMAYHDGEWLYFDNTQKTRKRDLASAVQLPVYYKLEKNNYIVKGILSIDTDKPNFFLEEEIDVWREELIHYLVNLCLTTTLHECGT
jgi:hypothetical protein